MSTRQRKRHTPEQVVRKLQEADRLLAEGVHGPEVARQLGISEQTYYRWRNQFRGLKAHDVKRLRQLERENSTLKRLLAEAELEKAALKEIAKGILSPARRRIAVHHLQRVMGVSERFACRVVGQHRSTQRHMPASDTIEDPDSGLREWLRDYARQHPRWGHRRAYHDARAQGWVVNHKEGSAVVAPGVPVQAGAAAPQASGILDSSPGADGGGTKCGVGDRFPI